MTDIAIRHSARLLILNERDECFLFHHQDQPDGSNRPLHRYWVLPGGGVEPSETWERAALRELWEETGIEDVPLGPWLWSREKIGSFAGATMHHIERYYLIRVTGRPLDVTHQLDHERAVYQQHHWWSLEELRSTADTVYPEGFPALLEPILNGHLPAAPITITPPT